MKMIMVDKMVGKKIDKILSQVKQAWRTDNWYQEIIFCVHERYEFWL